MSLSFFFQVGQNQQSNPPAYERPRGMGLRCCLLLLFFIYFFQIQVALIFNPSLSTAIHERKRGGATSGVSWGQNLYVYNRNNIILFDPGLKVLNAKDLIVSPLFCTRDLNCFADTESVSTFVFQTRDCSTKNYNSSLSACFGVVHIYLSTSPHLYQSIIMYICL